MPLKKYGVLKGRAIGSRQGSGQNPHFQIHLIDDTTDYRTAVNVKSSLSPSDLYYLVDESFAHPLTDFMSPLDSGFHELSSTPDSGAVDYIRGNLFDPTRMKLLPFSVPGPDNDLNEKIGAFVSRAIEDERATVCVFGERWGPEANKKDKIFGFLPGNGIHDVHMNQGNAARYRKDDGVWQDGAMFIHFPAVVDDDEVERFPEQWVAVFLAFQSQVWHTDDTTGHRLPGFSPGLPGSTPPVPVPGGPGTGAPGNDDPSQGDGRIRIVAALVNPSGHDPGLETVTLVNTTAAPIDLAGWMIADKHKQKATLNPQSLEAGAAIRILLSGDDVQLGNKGGIITLLDPAGIKVHGVSYTRTQATAQGRTIVF